MQRRSRFRAFIATSWRNWVVGVDLVICGVLLGESSVFRHDLLGHSLFIFAHCLLIGGGLIVVAAVVHALRSGRRRDGPGGAG